MISTDSHNGVRSATRLAAEDRSRYPLAVDRSGISYWDDIAPTLRIAPPLAPSAEDIEWMQARVADFGTQCGGGRAVLLGVTPAIACMSWPIGTALWAVDWSAQMIRTHWPALAVRPSFRVLRSDWRALPLQDASIDCAIGDGCYTALQSFEQAKSMNCELSRVIRGGGRYILRCFARPKQSPSLPELFKRVERGEVDSPDLLRWLLAMAVQGSSRDGVAHARVWNAWREYADDHRAVVERLSALGYGVAGFERFRLSKARYYFPDVDDLRGLAEPWFEVLECDVPPVAWGECFPRLLMRRRA